MTLSVVTLVGVTTALLAALAAADSMPPPYIFHAPIAPAVVHRPIMITLHGTNFTQTTAVRLAGNETGGCRKGTAFSSIDTVPPGTVSNVARWSETGNNALWVVRLRASVAQSRVLVCYTTDGHHWHEALNTAGSSSFRVWPRMPYAIPTPWVLSSGLLARFTVYPPQVAHSARGVLVSSPAGCLGPEPTAVVAGGEVVAMDTATRSVAFTPRTDAKEAFLCIAEFPFNQWTIIPIDTLRAMTLRGGGGFPNGDHLESLGIEIFPAAQRHAKGHLTCTTLIGGARATCEIRVVNRTAIPVSAASVRIEELHDGGGNVECPLPRLETVDEHTLRFTWTPQHWGREGLLQVRYNGLPLVFEETPMNEEYYRWLEVRNATYEPQQVREIPRTFRDGTVTRFLVQPPYSHLDSYSHPNLVNFHYFQPNADVVFQNGVVDGVFAGRQNGTIHRELLSASIRTTPGAPSSVTFGQTVPLPEHAARCRMSAFYYYVPEATDLDISVHIGTVRFMVLNSGGSTVHTRTFNLFSLGRKVVVTGATRRGSLDGDIHTFEQLLHEVSIVNGGVHHYSARIELYIDHSQNPRLYFVEPRVRCAVMSPRSDSREVQALQRLYDAFAGSITPGRTMATWKREGGQQWNGDPCGRGGNTGLWAGVECRHYRVVGLHLANNNLFGEVPPGVLQAFEMLETLRLDNNLLQGTLQINNTRLQVLDASHNRLLQLSVRAEARQCLRVVKAAHNVLERFPRDTTGMPRLEVLDLHRNNMHSTMPHFVDQTPQLEILHVSDNYLVGPLPQLPPQRLRSVDLSANRFNGTIPLSYGDMQHVRFLDLSKNALVGPLPVELARIRTAADLVLRAEDNYLSGPLPRLPVRKLDVRDNFFVCPLPTIRDYTTEDPDNVVGVLTVLQCDEVGNGQ